MDKLQLYFTRSYDGFNHMLEINAVEDIKKQVYDLTPALEDIGYDPEKINFLYLLRYTDQGTFVVILRTIPHQHGNHLAAWIFIPSNLSVGETQLANIIDKISEIISNPKITADQVNEIKTILDKDYERIPSPAATVANYGETYAHRFYGGDSGYNFSDFLGNKRYQTSYLPYAGVLLIDAEAGLTAKGPDLTDDPLEQMVKIFPPMLGLSAYHPRIFGKPFDKPYLVPLMGTVDIIWQAPGVADVNQQLLINKPNMRPDAISAPVNPVLRPYTPKPQSTPETSTSVVKEQEQTNQEDTPNTDAESNGDQPAVEIDGNFVTPVPDKVVPVSFEPIPERAPEHEPEPELPEQEEPEPETEEPQTEEPETEEPTIEQPSVEQPIPQETETEETIEDVKPTENLPATINTPQEKAEPLTIKEPAPQTQDTVKEIRGIPHDRQRHYYFEIPAKSAAISGMIRFEVHTRTPLSDSPIDGYELSEPIQEGASRSNHLIYTPSDSWRFKAIYALAGLVAGILLTLLCKCAFSGSSDETTAAANDSTAIEQTTATTETQPQEQATTPDTKTEQTPIIADTSLRAAISYLDTNKTWDKATLEAYPDLRGLYADMNSFNKKRIIDHWGPKLNGSRAFANVAKHAKLGMKKKPRVPAGQTTFNKSGEKTSIKVQSYLNAIDP